MRATNRAAAFRGASALRRVAAFRDATGPRDNSSLHLGAIEPMPTTKRHTTGVTRPGRQTGAAHRKGPWGASETIVECTGAHGWRHEAATPQSSMTLERWLWPVTEDQHWQSAECCLSFAYAKAEPGEALSLQTPATQVAFTWIQAAGSAPLADRTQLAAYTIDSDGYVGKRLKA